MRVFHPMAQYKMTPTYVSDLFVQTGCITEEAARAQLRLWRDAYGFDITKAWIDIHEDGKIVETIDVTADLLNGKTRK